MTQIKLDLLRDQEPKNIFVVSKDFALDFKFMKEIFIYDEISKKGIDIDAYFIRRGHLRILI